MPPANSRKRILDEIRAEKRASFGSGICHAKQASLVNAIVLGQARQVAALYGRQTGKSFAGVVASLLLASTVKESAIYYVSSTVANVERYGYNEAKRLNEKYNLGGKTNDTKHTIRFKGFGVIYFLGADHDKTIGRLRGTPGLICCIVDEAGVYESDQLRLIIETVLAGLRPRAGKLVLMGTPSMAGPTGAWYEYTTNSEVDQHRATYLDNDRVPSFDKVEELIEQELRFLGKTRESAYYRREYLCDFVVDSAERVYAVGESNYYDGEPPDDLETFATGGDVGTTASDALVTIGWKDGSPDVWVVEEKEQSGQDSVDFAAMVLDVYERRHPIVIAVDPGGGGARDIKTVQRFSPSVPISASPKGPLPLQVKATNALLRRLKIPRGSKLAQELARPTWKGGIVGNAIVEHGKHSDLVPALRYVAIAVADLLPDIPELVEESPSDRIARERTDRMMSRLQAVKRPQWERDADALGLVASDDWSDVMDDVF